MLTPPAPLLDPPLRHAYPFIQSVRPCKRRARYRDEDSEHSGDEREGDEQEVALSEAAILRLMA